MARGHSKSQSVSSDTPNTKAINTPAKPSNTARTTTRRSPTSHPASPTSPAALVRAVTARKPNIPAALRFPLVVILSFILSSLLFTLVAEFGAGDLASVSKHTESWFDVAGLLGWRVVFLALCWFGGFDAFDALALSLLTLTPQLILLYTFFAIRPSSLLLNLLSTALSTAVPFALLRPISAFHHPRTAAAGSLRNRSVLTDLYTTLSTSVLASAVFAVILEASFATFLPTFLITYFDLIRDLRPAHLGAAGLPTLLLSLLPAGYAAHEFLFAGPTGALPRMTPARPYTFDPVSAGFRAHLYHNAWGWYSERQKVLIIRTVFLGLLVIGETIIQTWGTVKGVRIEGAIGYAALWAAGMGLVGAVFEWVGGASG